MSELDTGFTTPTMAELVERISDDLNVRLPGEDARLRQSTLWVLTRVLAGAVYGIYRFAHYVARQILPDTASSTTLSRHAQIWGLVRRAAIAAQGNLTVTFAGAGIVVPIGTEFQRGDGVAYTTDAGYVSTAAPPETIAVTAAEADLDGNATAGTIATAISPIAGMTSMATVAAGGMTGGADLESDDDLRVRIAARITDTPQGGAAADYVAWALATPTVAVGRAWAVGSATGPGTVGVWFTLESGVFPVPAGDVTAVQAYLDARRPVTAALTVAGAVAENHTMTVAVVPNTDAVRAAVTAQITALFAAVTRIADGTGTIRNSEIRAAIARAAGEEYHTLNSIDGDGTGLSNIAIARTEAPVLSPAINFV